MARRRKTPATNTMPVQSINPESKQTTNQKPKSKMDAAGMKSWDKVLSGETPDLPKNFTENLGTYAGPSKKKNKRNRGKRNGQATPTPATQPLTAPTPAAHIPAAPTSTVPTLAAPVPAIAAPVIITPAPVTPAVPVSAVSIASPARSAPAVQPVAPTSTIPIRARVTPAVPISTGSNWAAIARLAHSVPAVLTRAPVPTPVIVTPTVTDTVVSKSTAPTPVTPAVPVSAIITPAPVTSASAVPAVPTLVIATPTVPVPVIPSSTVPVTTSSDKGREPRVSFNQVPKKVERVKIPTLWDLCPAYSGKNLGPSDRFLGFRYNRDWVSFGVGAKDVGGLLQREFKRQRRAGLPPLYVDIAEENLGPLRQLYEKAGELGLYNKRLAIRRSGRVRDAFPTSYVFQTSREEKANGNFLNNLNPLVQFLMTPEFAMRLFDNIKPCMRDILSLATTCRAASICVSDNLEVWDSRRGEFFTEDHFKGEEGGLRSNIVVVTQTTSGFPVTVSPYSSDFRAMARILSGMSEMRFSFQDLVLDKIPFLDCDIVEVIVNSMPNLKTIGISNCLLLDVTKLEPILDVVARHPIVSDREAETAVYVQIDWQPFFFNGLNGLDTSESPGSFGITHNPPTFNIPKAVFGLIMKALPMAKKVGMDLLSEGSSFWRFVRRLPGPDVLWATKARDAIVVYQLGLASVTKLNGHIPVKALKAAKSAFADDITAALSGDGVEPIVVPGRFNAPSRGLSFNYGYWRGERKCLSCDTMMFRTFFPIHTKVCWPCKMVQFVNTAESSHMRHRLQSAVDFWTADLRGYEHPTLENVFLDTLVQRLRAGSVIAFNAARDIDHAWFHHLKYTTGPRGLEPLYPEPTNARPDAMWFRRSLMVHEEVFPRGDYREGGPQHEHPALWPIFPEMQTSPTTKGCEPYEHFCATWVYNDKSEDALAQFFMDALAVNEHLDVERNHHRVQEFLAGARENLNQQIKARELEWIAQNEANSKWYMAAMADVEDCIVSNIGPGPRSWNRDAVKNAERALEPMNLFGEYMGKNNFQN